MGPAGEKFHLYVLLTVPYAVYFRGSCSPVHMSYKLEPTAEQISSHQILARKQPLILSFVRTPYTWSVS